MRKLAILIIAITSILSHGTSHAQSLDDALRLGIGASPTGTRAMGMGGAMISASNDLSGLDWNPATLAPLEFNEIDFGMWNRNHTSTATYFGNAENQEIGNANLANLGLLVQLPTERGHFNLGISYDLVRAYDATYHFSGFNPSSSFLSTAGLTDDIPHSDMTPNQYISYLMDHNLSWNLYLSTLDTVKNVLIAAPFHGGTTQSGTVEESGSEHATRLGGAIDIAEGIALGATLNIYNGTYQYNRSYLESYSNSDSGIAPLGLRSATIYDQRTQQQEGVGLKLGFLYYENPLLRVGATIESPTYMRVNDILQRTGNASYAGHYYTVDYQSYPDLTSYENNYTVVTPLKLGAGVSSTIGELTLAASGTFTDMSQMRFSNWDVDLSDLNDNAKANLRTVISWSVGAEYVLPFLGTSVRAGYGVEPSPYKSAASNQNTTSISGGLGILVSKSILLEAAYRRQSYHTSHVVYNDVTAEPVPTQVSASVTDDAVIHDDFQLSISYRF